MVEYLEYRNQKLPIRVKMSVLQKYEEETGESWDKTQVRLQEANEKGEHTSITEVMNVYKPILFYGLASGAKATNHFKVMVPWFDENGQDTIVELTRDNDDILDDILDDCMQDLIALFPKFFPEAEKVNETKKPMPGNRSQRRQETRLKEKS